MEILLVVNSVLLSFLSVMFLIIGYFLKDLHKDFKAMVEKVNTLVTEHKAHVTVSENFDTAIDERVNTLQREVHQLSYRCEQLERAK